MPSHRCKRRMPAEVCLGLKRGWLDPEESVCDDVAVRTSGLIGANTRYYA